MLLARKNKGFSFHNQDTFHLFRFWKRAGKASPLPTECASVSLNILKYPWKCLNKLFWICLGSEYARSSYMFDRILKMPRLLNKPGFWIWRGCICKGYAEFRIYNCLIMVPYASNMAEYYWMSLNKPKVARINCSDYAIVLNMPR